MKNQQALEIKIKSSTISQNKSAEASLEKSPVKEPESLHHATGLFSTMAGGTDTGNTGRDYQLLFKKPQLYEPVNTPVRNQAVLQMQRNHGNSYVQRMFEIGALHAELKIGKPGDKYEREADRVAEWVMRMKEPSIHKGQDEDQTAQRKPLAVQITPLVRRQVDPEEEKKKEEELLQTKGLASGTPEVTPALSAGITSMKGGGQPLPEGTRTIMEQRFGHDFSRVRIHTDNHAAETARGLNAQAFTVGSDITFGAGKYAPGTQQGMKLLTHELTHVVQQSSSASNRSKSWKGTNRQSNRQFALQCKDSGHRKRKRKRTTKTKPEITWEEAFQVLDAITDIINRFVEVKGGMAYPKFTPAAHKDVPTRWQPLLHEWWMITNGTIKYPDGLEVSYYGDILAEHINRAVDKTAPLVKVLLAEGNEKTAPWLAEYYVSRVREFRGRAVREAVSKAIEKATEKGVGGALDIKALGDVEKLKIGSSQALTTIGALMTVAVRAAGANARYAKEIEELYAKAMGGQEVPASLKATKAMNLQTGLLYVQGGLRLVQAIVNVADPEKRREIYENNAKRFGPVASYTEIIKNLVQFVSGATAVAGAGTYAVAKVLGRVKLATHALSMGGKALGKINVALNALGVIHGIAVLVDKEATTEESAEAVVEVGSGGLGLIGRFIPALSGVAAAASASLLINFYAFRGIFSHAMQGVAGLISLGLNICYNYMSEQARYISRQAMSYAASLDMARVITDPPKAAELAKQTEALRWNLVEFFIKEFMENATRTYGAANKDPGGYEILRRRFLPLKDAKLETDAQIIAFTKRLLETILQCFIDAKEIYREQVEYSWEHH